MHNAHCTELHLDKFTPVAFSSVRKQLLQPDLARYVSAIYIGDIYYRDVTELSLIRRMRIQLFNSGRMRIRIYIYALLKVM